MIILRAGVAGRAIIWKRSRCTEKIKRKDKEPDLPDLPIKGPGEIAK
jgi:hypothetical protein